jgi:hypothetical protein
MVGDGSRRDIQAFCCRGHAVPFRKKYENLEFAHAQRTSCFVRQIVGSLGNIVLSSHVQVRSIELLSHFSASITAQSSCKSMTERCCENATFIPLAGKE